MRPLLSLVLGLSALGAVACADDGAVEADESNISQSLTLRFESADGKLSLKSSGKVLACTERFDGLDGERVTCARKGERLQVIVKEGGASVVAVRDLGKERGYYECKPDGDVDGLPAHMKCGATKLRPRGTGGLSSPFDSSVPGITIPNTHWVNDGETVLRGMEPRTPGQFDELRGAGIEKVIIFKNATGQDEVTKEIAAWGLPAGDVLHVPFKWKELEDFKTPCTQTLDALRFIRASEKAGKKVFFHCTVGEDRTGYLAALYARLFEGMDATEAFDQDMCEHGYSSGNPQKPGFVVGALAEDLTPLYRSMSFLIEEGKLTKKLETSACAAEPDVPDDFMSEPLACGVSTTLVP